MTLGAGRGHIVSDTKLVSNTIIRDADRLVLRMRRDLQFDAVVGTEQFARDPADRLRVAYGSAQDSADFRFHGNPVLGSPLAQQHDRFVSQLADADVGRWRRPNQTAGNASKLAARP
jgi:hypothetical protein